MQEDARLTSYAPSPDLPPLVWANDVLLSITQYEWTTPEGVVTHIVEKPEDAVITPVQSAAPPLRLTISPAIKPSALVVSFFPEVDERGFPVLSSGINFDCFESDQCHIAIGDSSMNVKIEQMGIFRFAVLRVAYLNEASSVSQKAKLSTASWVMSFTT